MWRASALKQKQKLTVILRLIKLIWDRLCALKYYNNTRKERPYNKKIGLSHLLFCVTKLRKVLHVFLIICVVLITLFYALKMKVTKADETMTANSFYPIKI